MSTLRLNVKASRFLKTIEDALGTLPAGVRERLAAQSAAAKKSLGVIDVLQAVIAAMPGKDVTDTLNRALDSATQARTTHQADGTRAQFLNNLIELRKLALTKPDEPSRRRRGKAIEGAEDAPDAKASFSLQLIHMNDSHSNYSNVSRVASIIKSARQMDPEAIVVHAGDALVGTPLYTVGGHGKAEMKILKQLGVSIFVPGNHEWDGGVPDLATALKQAPEMEVVAANLEVTGALAERVKPYTIRQVQGHRVAFVGLTVDPGEYNISTDEVRYRKPVDTLQELLPRIMQQEQPEAIVVLSHLGASRDKELAGYFPEVNAWIGGHSHTVINWPKRILHPDFSRSLVVQAGEKFENVGFLELGLRDGQIISHSGSLMPVTDSIEPDKDMERLLKSYQKGLDEFGQVIGVSRNVVGGTGRTAGDSRLGNFITDMIRETLKAEHGPIDIAIFNRTGLRNSLPKGEITVGTLYEIFPFPNKLSVITLTGEQVQAMLDTSASRGGDPISGVTYKVDRGKAVHVKVNGKALKPTATYRVASNNYMMDGGSGYSVLTQGTDRVDTAIDVRAMLKKAFQDMGDIQIPRTAEKRTTHVDEDLGTTIRKRLNIKEAA